MPTKTEVSLPIESNGVGQMPEALKAALEACRPNLVKRLLAQRLLAHSLSIRFVVDPEVAVMAADAGFHGP
jgi:hypothetical protein